ncbi:uracil phosphoribosyltransferase [Anaeroplasma bactoclasticum]|jgi:uracil phosphoribosyltransferase|uniref:Uracil phosphoribosyltransferase n=1 Tax=Anaeroplasma bactoclasticum TaxID=2088 RepID=A0A397RVS1_9MOLU|nr:uracil phosphoribosyltransferase [Anaeroplasma bactoclasticum]RIA77808.1 uracil phosphoribosyltransferase [Anaeroplasma bactoclasticum]
MSVTVLNHSLIKHKLTNIRKTQTTTKDFYQNVNEIAGLMAYEITRDFPLKPVEIETPICKSVQYELANEVVIVPILRAGLGMVDGIRSMIPTAKVGFIGLYRDEETLEPHEYYAKFPETVKNSIVLLVDPMLATGGSASSAITMLKKRGCKDIRYVGLVAAPEGVRTLQKDHPDVPIYLAALDEKLNENGYIVPGLGDCGDRLFGTR